jgi:membrane associated rhomboid family serine protease
VSDISQNLVNTLIVQMGFHPLDRGLAHLQAAAGGFDQSAAKLQGKEYWVHAVLEYRGQDVDDVAQRAERLREVCKTSENYLPRGVRLKAVIWLVAEGEVPQAFWDGIRAIPAGHFLSKSLLSIACLDQEGSGKPRLRQNSGQTLYPSASWFSAPLSKTVSGEEVEIELKSREEEARRARLWLSGKNTWGTYALIGLNVAYFLVGPALVSHAPDSEAYYFDLGANNRLLVLGQGQWPRLLSNLFVHFGWFHLVANMVSLFSVGTFLERLGGSGRFLGLYFLSGLVGSLAGLMNAPTFMDQGTAHLIPSGGASGAIFGVVGALLALHWRRPAGFPKQIADRLFKSLARPSVTIFAAGIVTAYLSRFGFPFRLDNWAHLGGLSAGFLVSFVFPIHSSRHFEGQA